MSESGSNERSEDMLRTGVYHPRRGPLARIVALLILVLLVLIPSVLFVLSMFANDRPPPDRAASPGITPARPVPPR